MTSPDRNAERTAQRGREVRAIIARMESELNNLEAQLEATTGQDERARIETEIVQLALALAPLRGGHYNGG